MRFIWIKTYRIVYFSPSLFAKHRTLSSWCQIFSSRSTSRKILIFSVSKFSVYCCHSDIDFTKNCILINFPIHSQSLVKNLYRSDKDKITFKVIEKHRYGLLKTGSNHLNLPRKLVPPLLSNPKKGLKRRVATPQPLLQPPSPNPRENWATGWGG